MNIRCYDNENYMDRFTVVYMDEPDGHLFRSVSMSASPFHPQGVGQHGLAKPGRHLGRRMRFTELPLDCQKLVTDDLMSVLDNTTQ